MHSCDITAVKELYPPVTQKFAIKKVFTDAEAMQIIEYIQGYPYMFNHKMLEHQDRQLLQMHWRTLGALLNASAEEVQAKFRNLRTQYYREKKKEAESLRGGSGTGAIYTSKWKFFAALSFLDTVVTLEDTDTNLNNGSSLRIEEDEEGHSHLLECSSAASSVMSLNDMTPSEIGGPLHIHKHEIVVRENSSRRMEPDSNEQAFAHMVAVELQRERNEMERRRKKAAISKTGTAILLFIFGFVVTLILENILLSMHYFELAHQLKFFCPHLNLHNIIRTMSHHPVNNSVEDSMRRKISDALKPTHMEIKNESYMHNVPKGSETHFKLLIVSDAFIDVPLIKRHHIVYDILKNELQGPVHALSIQAKTPDQWKELEASCKTAINPSPPCRGGFGM